MVCKTVVLEEEDQPVDDPDGPQNPGDDPSGPQGPDISEPNIIFKRTEAGLAEVTFGITNDGDQGTNQSVKGSIDVGKTGQVNARRETILTIPAGEQVTSTFSFDVQLDQDTEAQICVEKP